MNSQEKIQRFNELQEKLSIEINETQEKSTLEINAEEEKSNLEVKEEQELNQLAKEFLEMTRQTYDRVATTYSDVNGTKMIDSYRNMYDILFKTAEKELEKPIEDMEVLDVGTGPGRDIKFMYSKGIKRVVGLDNSEEFIKILKELEEKGEIPKNSFVKGDMLDIPFDNEIFDIVRQNASLLHIPITIKGEMLDKAIQESYRVLKENGILFVSVKKGKGVQLIDTKEGLGARIYQMHTVESITKILEEHHFRILDIIEIEEQRKDSKIDWINVIAKKCK